jgi:hypothetical protein
MEPTVTVTIPLAQRACPTWRCLFCVFVRVFLRVLLFCACNSSCFCYLSANHGG